MKRQMENGAGINSSDDETTITRKHDNWVAAHPDWNKIVLVPVSTETSSTGYSKIYNEFELTSTKLVGGSNTPIQISVVYSHFNK